MSSTSNNLAKLGVFAILVMFFVGIGSFLYSSKLDREKPTPTSQSTTTVVEASGNQPEPPQPDKLWKELSRQKEYSDIVGNYEVVTYSRGTSILVVIISLRGVTVTTIN
jgi:hypothetical protein